MCLLPDRFEIRTALFSVRPLNALRALDAPGITVCDVITRGEELPQRIAALEPHVLVLADAPVDPQRLYRDLSAAVPACPPRVIACFPQGKAPDAVTDLNGLAACVGRVMLAPCAALAKGSLPRRESLGRQLLCGIGMSESLLGFDCLVRGAALLSAVPPPAPPLQNALYPQLARESGVSAAAVEKRIRGAVESAWLHGSLAEQTRLLGLSVSAERGKPTNSELLFRMAQKIRESL